MEPSEYLSTFQHLLREGVAEELLRQFIEIILDNDVYRTSADTNPRGGSQMLTQFNQVFAQYINKTQSI